MAGVVIGLFVLLVGIYIFINTFNINKYLPQITQQVSQAIGREVKVQRAKLHFSLIEGVAASVEGILIGDDPLFGDRPFLTIGQIRCGVRLGPLLTKRQIEVSYIRIHSPEVNLIKGKNGTFNFESLMKAPPAAQPQPASSSGGGQAKPSAKPPSLPLLLVSTFQIEKAKVNYVDYSFTPPMEFVAKDIDIEVIDFSLQEPFKIKAEASLFSDRPNVHVNALGRLDLNLQQARLDDGHVNVDLAMIDIKKLNKSLAALEPAGIQSVKGTMNVVASQMVAGAGGLLVLSLEGQLIDGQVVSKLLAVPIDKILVKFDASESKINLKDFSLALGSGQVHAQGVVKDYMTRQQFDFNVDVDQLPLGEIIDQTKYPAQIKGLLTGNVKINGAGFTPEAMDQITGQSLFSIADGELVGVNIVQTVLGHIKIIPGLGDAVESQLSPELRQKIGGKNTVIDKADVKTRIERSNVIIDTAELQAQGFRLSAHGNVGFDQTIAMQAELVLLKELARALMASAHEMEALADENQEIHIPVQITGKASALSIVPDMNYLSKRILVNQGSKQLEKVIEKNPEVKQILDIFTGGGRSQPSNGAPDADTDQTESAPQESPEKKLLDNLFKGF